jgi:hypothetical protein
VIDLLIRLPNVYADTSGVRRFDYLVQAVKRAGPRKILFGSDGPWLHPGLELHKIRLLGLPRDAEALILGGNALRLMQNARVGAAPGTAARRRSQSVPVRPAATHEVQAHPAVPEVLEYQL